MATLLPYIIYRIVYCVNVCGAELQYSVNRFGFIDSINSHQEKILSMTLRSCNGTTNYNWTYSLDKEGFLKNQFY